MGPIMPQQLVVSALGHDRPGLVAWLSARIQEAGGNILDSRMTILGGEFAVLLLVDGDEASLRVLNEALPAAAPSEGLVVQTRLTESRAEPTRESVRAYRIEAMDHPGIVQRMAAFFSERQVNIEDLRTETYAAAHTASPLFAAELTVRLSADTDPAALDAALHGFAERWSLVIQPVEGNPSPPSP